MVKNLGTGIGYGKTILFGEIYSSLQE